MASVLDTLLRHLGWDLRRLRVQRERVFRGEGLFNVSQFLSLAHGPSLTSLSRRQASKRASY